MEIGKVQTTPSPIGLPEAPVIGKSQSQGFFPKICSQFLWKPLLYTDLLTAFLSIVSIVVELLRASFKWNLKNIVRVMESMQFNV
jgi:hypothetical protein